MHSISADHCGGDYLHTDEAAPRIEKNLPSILAGTIRLFGVQQ